MRFIVITLLLLIAITSCDKTITEIRIILKNESNQNFNIVLYPKKEYLNGENYRSSKLGSGYQPTTFELSKYTEMEPVLKVLYSTDDLSLSATDLAKQVFDSIRVVAKNDPKCVLFFSHDQVNGYTKNLFTDAAAWSYGLNTFYEPVGLKRTTFEAHDYTFTIKNVVMELP
jgi:hypothetical protein